MMPSFTEGGIPAAPLPSAAYLDHIVFKKKNPIIARSISLMCSIVVYGCMSIEAWQWTYTSANDGGKKTKTCLYSESGGVCTFGIFVSFVALVAAILFIGGEFLVEKTYLVKYRREYYKFDLGFSAFWTFLFIVCFFVLENQWSSMEQIQEPEGPEGSMVDPPWAGSIKTAIWFSFFSIITWGCSTYMALQRYRVMKAEAQYGDTTGRRPSAYPATINVPGTTVPQGPGITTPVATVPF